MIRKLSTFEHKRINPVLICECGNRYIRINPTMFKYPGVQEKCLECYQGKHPDFRLYRNYI